MPLAQLLIVLNRIDIDITKTFYLAFQRHDVLFQSRCMLQPFLFQLLRGAECETVLFPHISDLAILLLI